MKRASLVITLLIVTFLAADAMRALLGGMINSSAIKHLEAGVHTWLTSGAGVAVALAGVFLLVFFIAGLAAALIVKEPVPALLSSIAVGLASPLSTLPFGPPTPTTWITHSPPWLEALFWANWYVPPIAAAAGAAAILVARSRSVATRPHAA